MKTGIPLKLLAFLLAVVCAVSGAACAAAALYCVEQGMYGDAIVKTPSSNERELYAAELAQNIAQRIAWRTYGDYPETFESVCDADFIEEPEIYAAYSVWTSDGEYLEGAHTSDDDTWEEFSFRILPQYPQVQYEFGILLPSSSTAATSPVDPMEGTAAYDYYGGYRYSPLPERNFDALIYEDGVRYAVTFHDVSAPYQVTIWLPEGSVPVSLPESDRLALNELLYSARWWVLTGGLVSLVLFVVSVVYLCWAAGRKGDEIRPGGLNRLPFDFYAVNCMGLAFVFLLILSQIPGWDAWEGQLPLMLAAMALTAAVPAACGVAVVFSFAAQVKQKGFLWSNSVTGRLFGLAWKLLRWLGTCISLFPVIWQWLLTAVGMLFVMAAAFACSVNLRSAVPFFFGIVLCVLVVIYGGWCFGRLLVSLRRMAQGNLDEKIDTYGMVGAFRQFGVCLNALSGAAMIAAQEQMKSERMKTELITNVSHDIKTPLTSIINYVDLLERPHTPEEERQYLEVLSRQSQRMKKLIEDLIEMSKATTGNITAQISPLDAAEAVNQALGEFSDKLAAVPLTPVFRAPEEPVTALADGRLLWRVLSNLLGNAVKYAQPGTRLYVDVVRVPDRVLISLKNVSREALNISSEELMERFVRGDSSRGSEGSGLGLNIARGLMETQGGTLELLVDGDLFKVTLSLPGGTEPRS